MTHSAKKYIVFIFGIFILLSSIIASKSYEKINSTNNSFIIIGDSQRLMFWESLYWDFWGEHNEEETKLLFSEISKQKPDFIVHLGDFVSKGSSRNSWKDFAEDAKPIFDNNLKILPILGNHEFMGNNKKMFKFYHRFFPNIKNPNYSSYNYNGIGIITFNSNFDELTEKERNEQLSWFRQELKSMEKDSSVSKIIIACHHPFFTNSKIVSPSEELSEYYLKPFINNYKTIAAFSGHCHSYEKFSVEGKYFIVSGGGGGARQKLQIDTNKRKYNDLFNGEALRFFHFCKISIEDNLIIFRVIKLNDSHNFSVADSLKFYLD